MGSFLMFSICSYRILFFKQTYCLLLLTTLKMIVFFWLMQFFSYSLLSFLPSVELFFHLFIFAFQIMDFFLIRLYLSLKLRILVIFAIRRGTYEPKSIIYHFCYFSHTAFHFSLNSLFYIFERFTNLFHLTQNITETMTASTFFKDSRLLNIDSHDHFGCIHCRLFLFFILDGINLRFKVFLKFSELSESGIEVVRDTHIAIQLLIYKGVIFISDPVQFFLHF